MIQLVARMIHRVHHLNRTHHSLKEMQYHLLTLGRLVVSYARGRYQSVPLKTLLVILAAFLYFLNPFDLVPDAIPGAGFMDDLAVITWVYRTVKQQLTEFIKWENYNVIFDRS